MFEKTSTFVRQALKSVVENGSVAQTKGKDTSGFVKIEGKKLAPKKTSLRKLSPKINSSENATLKHSDYIIRHIGRNKGIRLRASKRQRLLGTLHLKRSA